MELGMPLGPGHSQVMKTYSSCIHGNAQMHFSDACLTARLPQSALHRSSRACGRELLFRDRILCHIKEMWLPRDCYCGYFRVLQNERHSEQRSGF